MFDNSNEKKYDYIVDVIMPVYNQEEFVSQAIESVLMQKTDFPVRLIIGDDYSKDKTREICQKYALNYPTRVKLILNDRNIGLLENYKRIFNAAIAKYIAILEGDDYWIDEFKLRKQVNYFETHPAVGLVHTNCYDIIWESGKIKNKYIHHINSNVKSGYIYEDLLNINSIYALTAMFRKNLYDKYIQIDDYIKNNFKTVDYGIWLDIARHSEIHYINDITANYRVHNMSISNSGNYGKNIEFLRTTYNIKIYSAQKYLDKKRIHEIENGYIVNLITINMSLRNHEKVSSLYNELQVYNYKSIVVKILASNKLCVNLYSYINNRRQQNLLNIKQRINQ